MRKTLVKATDFDPDLEIEIVCLQITNILTEEVALVTERARDSNPLVSLSANLFLHRHHFDEYRYAFIETSKNSEEISDLIANTTKRNASRIVVAENAMPISREEYVKQVIHQDLMKTIYIRPVSIQIAHSSDLMLHLRFWKTIPAGYKGDCIEIPDQNLPDVIKYNLDFFTLYNHPRYQASKGLLEQARLRRGIIPSDFTTKGFYITYSFLEKCAYHQIGNHRSPVEWEKQLLRNISSTG